MIAFPDMIGVAVANVFQLRIDFPAPAALGNNGMELFLAGLANRHPQAIICEDIQLLDIIYRFAAHDRVHTAGVVADHSAQRAVCVCSRIGRQDQLALFRSIAQFH